MVTTLVFTKMLAKAGALSRSFIGGLIFPLLFIGGKADTAPNLIFPDIPLTLAVACLMAAVPGALLPVHLTLVDIVILITGIPETEAIPVFIAVILAGAITHRLGLLAGGYTKEPSDRIKGFWPR